MIESEREAETQAEGEAGSMQGAQRETRTRVSRTTPWARGRRQTAEPPRDSPLWGVLKKPAPSQADTSRSDVEWQDGRSILHPRPKPNIFLK